jgi:phosphoglycolate phosphatase-like HAD superfamily hydrolase
MGGDRKHYIVTAKKNANKTIAVTYGDGSLQELILHQPDFLANDKKKN